MRNIILFDHEEVRQNLLPITFTRPIAEIRIGILTIREKWERAIAGNYSYLTQNYLATKYPSTLTDDNLFIAGHISPTPLLAESIAQLPCGEAIFQGEELIAFRGSLEAFSTANFTQSSQTTETPLTVNALYDIFQKNGEALEADFKQITAGRESEPLPDSNRVVGNLHNADGSPRLFIEKGAKVSCSILNLEQGYIYIGHEAEVMEGSCIRAPFAACEHAVVNMSTKIYGATTLGPYCKVGGELNNVVMLGYANKAHDGFLGNAVIGHWCNLGAGCTASNLKNDYSEIKLWNYPARRFLRTGLQFCGLIMGDHSKAGINTMFNTATVIGVGVNVYGAGFPRNFVASFSEGGTAGFNDVQLSKFFTVAEKVMARRHVELTEADKTIFEQIYHTAENLK